MPYFLSSCEVYKLEQMCYNKTESENRLWLDHLREGRTQGERIGDHIKKEKNMNEVVRRISLDLSRRSNTSLIFSSQLDMNSRVFLITLFDDGKRYYVEGSMTASVNVSRSDGTSAAFVADITDDGCVRYTAGSWALGIAGLTKFSVSLYEGEDKKLTSSCFTVDIAEGLYLGNDLSLNYNEKNTFQSMMNEVSAQKAALVEVTQKAEDAVESMKSSVEEASAATEVAINAAEKVETTLADVIERAESAEADAAESARLTAEYKDNAIASAADALASAGASRESSLSAADSAASAQSTLADVRAVAGKAIEDIERSASSALDSVEKSEKNAAASASDAAASAADACESALAAARTVQEISASAEAAERCATDAAESARALDRAVAAYGLMPIIDLPYSPEIVASANQMTHISELEGDIFITLGERIEGFDNEWCFVITQGETAYNVALPEILWVLDIAPAFDAGSVTEVRLHYKGEQLEGVWS